MWAPLLHCHNVGRIQHLIKTEISWNKIFFLIASAKFQSAVEPFPHPPLVGNYNILELNVFALPILQMKYYLSILSSVCGTVVVTLVVFEVCNCFQIKI